MSGKVLALREQECVCAFALRVCEKESGWVEVAGGGGVERTIFACGVIFHSSWSFVISESPSTPPPSFRSSLSLFRIDLPIYTCGVFRQ